ncbi:hypothetical protein BCR34DRAFT_589425 [Clohesyomyces aquaticus]|uniref:Uncharacterized protein n=1 Tax=Clohesyomyces aquaticus TaxID=1231657 RepID=A0A1Y1ZGD2_9PLEO|nr:hypothetical protein BCR34DRAFT_589425 [Clohesyomyces aquaticus]
MQKLSGPFHTDFVQDRPFVDPNRVYLLGFSAGGDGAFQHAAQLPDIFGAVSAAAGHPNGVPFTNTPNLPLCISSGGKDTLPTLYTLADKYSSGAKDCAQEIARNNVDLENLRQSVPNQFYDAVPKAYQPHVHNYQFYPHGCVIVQGRGHNKWAGPDMSNQKQRSSRIRKPGCFSKKTKISKFDGPNATDDKITNPVEWTCSVPSGLPKKFIPRICNPLPNFVVWDLATRPTAPGIDPREKEKPGWTPKNTIYWIYLSSNEIAKLSTLTA